MKISPRWWTSPPGSRPRRSRGCAPGRTSRAGGSPCFANCVEPSVEPLSTTTMSPRPLSLQAGETLTEQLAGVVVDDDGADSLLRCRSAGNAQAVSSATSPVIACSQLGSSSQPDSRKAALSSTELAGRGAGRGGSSSAVEIGSTLALSRPAASSDEARRSRTRSSSPGSSRGRCRDGGPSERSTTLAARSAAEVGLPRWSSTKRSASCALGQAQHGLDHVGPGAAVHPGGADDRVAVVELALAAELGAPVDRQRVRGVPLEIGPGERAVEDVVGRQVADVRADQAGRLGDVARAERVDEVGAVGVRARRRRRRSRRPGG